MSQSKVYVGNLPFTSTPEELQELFEGCGEITHLNIIKDRVTGRSKGFAFITFETDQGAQNALALNGKNLSNRALKVSIAREEENRAPRSNNNFSRDRDGRDNNRRSGGGYRDGGRDRE